jgi:RNase P/RNase MRP subunit p30
MKEDISLTQSENAIYLKKVSKKEDIKEDDKSDGYFIDTKGNEKETRRIIDSLKGKSKILAIQGSDNVFNRRVLETMNIAYLVSPEEYQKKDNLKQRDSGINHVTAKIAQKKGITFLINFSKLQSQDLRKKSITIARIMQNVEICRKANVKIKIASLGENKEERSNKKTRESFFSTLNATSKQVKESSLF